MYNFFIDLIIWSFAIFGFLKFVDEFALDSFYKVYRFFEYIVISLKKFVAKKYR